MRIVDADLVGLLPQVRTHDLARVGEIAVLMDAGHMARSIDTALACLREVTRADACELFLANPNGQELFLIAHLGSDIEAFSQRIRFAGKEGFPGIALQTGACLIADSLQSEAEFVRSRVKALRYQAAVTVPIRGAVEGAGGCLFLAWKGRPSELDALAGLVSLASRPIGTALEAARARVRLEGSRGLFGSDGVEDFTERLRVLTGGDTAGVFLSEEREWSESHGRGGPSHPIPLLTECCPARSCQSVQVSGGREGWPSECLAAGCTAKGRYCVPIIVDGATRAVVTAGFRDRAPVPLCRGLPPALWLAENLAQPQPGQAFRERERISATARPHPVERLQIRCFGGLEISVEGRPVHRTTLRREKARELLALLVAAGGRPIPGEHLAGQLWPGADPRAARSRLYVTLGALRAAIEPEGGEPWCHIRRDGSRYFLDPRSSVFVDMWLFQELIRRAKAGERGVRSREELLVILEKAVDLYEGDVFGSEFSGDWLDDLVARNRHAVLDALGRLAHIRAEVGDMEGAVAALRRTEEIDPLRQDLQRQLMTLLHALGRGEEALRCYERLEAGLAERLGLLPAPETRRLHHFLHHGC